MSRLRAKQHDSLTTISDIALIRQLKLKTSRESRLNLHRLVLSVGTAMRKQVWNRCLALSFVTYFSPVDRHIHIISWQQPSSTEYACSAVVFSE